MISVLSEAVSSLYLETSWLTVVIVKPVRKYSVFSYGNAV